MSTRFEWDAAKVAANRRRHGVSFETAIRVFADPFALTEQDRVDGGEPRWVILGVVEGQLLLLVAHIVSDEAEYEEEVIRMISVRKADRSERRACEDKSR